MAIYVSQMGRYRLREIRLLKVPAWGMADRVQTQCAGLRRPEAAKQIVPALQTELNLDSSGQGQDRIMGKDLHVPLLVRFTF